MNLLSHPALPVSSRSPLSLLIFRPLYQTRFHLLSIKDAQGTPWRLSPRYRFHDLLYSLTREIEGATLPQPLLDKNHAVTTGHRNPAYACFASGSY